MAIARAMMHNQAVHWPDVAEIELWPLAVLHAMFILNQIPWEDNGLFPLKMFTCREHWKFKLLNFHVWGCPVYALDNTLADRQKLPHWKPRAAGCVHVGQSVTHTEAAPPALCLGQDQSWHSVMWSLTIGFKP